MYSGDIFAGHARRRPRPIPEVAGDTGLVVEDAADGFCGAIVGWEKAAAGDLVRLEDRRGATRVFVARRGAFLIDGAPVTLTRPVAAPRGVRRSASGSVKAEGLRATSVQGPHVPVTGHPDIDVGEAGRPAAVGIAAWPQVPRGEDGKTGVCDRLGWGAPIDGWRRVEAAVSSFRDLEPPLIG